MEGAVTDMAPIIEKLLVANRGEIASSDIRTEKRVGIAAVAKQ